MLDLDTLIEEKKKIYVVNTSKPMHIMILDFINPSTGRSRSVRIPKTWIPICLSDQVPVSYIRESVDFRTYLMKGLLTLVDPSEAEKVLSTPEAKEEHDRIYKSKYSLSMKDLFKDGKPSQELMNMLDEVKIETVKESDINPKVRDLVLRYENKELDDSSIYHEIRTLSVSGELTEEDLSFLSSRVSGKAKSLCMDLLKEMVEKK